MKINYTFNILSVLSIKNTAKPLKVTEFKISKAIGLTLLALAFTFLISGKAVAQCSNYQVYESFGTALPTSGGTWAATSITYATTSPRTGANHLTFDAAGDAIRTPLITNPGIFSFWYQRSSNTTAHSFDIQTSPDGATWTSRGTTTTPTTTYQQFTVNLGALSLTNVYIRILDTRASGAHARYVDDISWTSTAANTLVPSLANCSQTVSCGTTYSFTDAGGSSDTYNISTDYTITFTPSLGTSKVQLVFSSFSTESGYDGMVIYNGPSTASPIFSSGLAVGTSATNCPAGSFYGATSPGTITSTDASGAITIRFRSDTTTNNAGWLASVSCYTPTTCATPTAQPTGLAFGTITTSSIAGSFTAASPAADKYIVVRSTSATPPATPPVNTTTYAAGNTLAGGETVVSVGNTTSFTASGLASGTNYYFYIYSYNDACSGGPLYLATSPLSGNTATQSAAVNDICSTAIGLTSNVSCSTTSGSTIGATDNDETGDCTNGTEKAVWYKFTAVATSHTVTVVGATGFDPVVGAISACGTTTTPTGGTCTDATGTAGTETLSLTGLTIGNTYYIQVYDYYGVNMANGFTICVTHLGPCSTPTAQPTALTFGALTTTSISGSFTAASPAPNKYLVVRSTSATAPSPAPANATTYAVGGTFSGATVVSISNTTSFTDSGLTAATQYYFYVYSYNDTSCTGGPTYLTTSPLTGTTATLAPPTNTSCALATNLPCATSNLSGTTSGTTSVAHGTVCTMGSYGVWYKFTGDGNQTTISSTATSGWDHEMSISSGSCGSFTNVTCQDSALSNGTEIYTFTTVAGVNYYVYISHWDAASTTTGSFTISRTCTAPPTTPANYLCSTATALPCATTNLAGTTVGTTGVAHGTACTMGNYGVWYTFIGDGNQTTISSTATSGWDHEMSISSGSCGSFTSITCQDSGFTNGTETYTFTAATGVNYYIYIASYASGSTTTGTFIISRTCTTPPPPMTNDDCSGAIALTVNPSCSYSYFTNATATASSGAPAPGCAGYSGGDVWFSAVVPANGILYIDSISGVVTDGGMALYSGTCGTLSLLACDDYSSANTGDMPFISRTGLTPGSVVYIRFWEYGNNNNGTFGICVTSPVACTTGGGTGNSNLACNEVLAGGLSLNGADPSPVNACVSSTCVDLEATYTHLKQTTSYTVQSIPFSPTPYQFGCLQNHVSVNIDDVWSPVVNLPFNFCYFGNNYNQCLISSNGALTFDMVNNVPEGASAWSFSNTLPSTSLFLNSIFGVYHDIDPSKGGEVGWELVTINSGCRALVVSWNDIPMFSTTCNSIKYTGMMVLYENTNVIEVYVSQKQLCPSWNGGNAIIGIQNSTGTVAYAPPGRNDVTADWTASNEAWRFTPSGTSVAATIKWFQGAGTSGPVVGTSANINVCPTTTTTYTAEITYPLCSGTYIQTDQTTVTVSGSKTWNGSISTDWNTSANWTPVGIPNGSDCVVIPITARNPIISGSGYNGLAGTLSVYNGATLTVNSGNSVTVTDWVNVGATGSFLVQSSASLVQINNVANTGNITYLRSAPNVRSLDYVYWSSPVANYNVNNITTPLAPGPIYSWNPTVTNPNGGQGNWQSATGSTMAIGKGYIVRAPGSFTATPSTLSGTFTGVPNNGTITVPISRGTYTGAPYNGANGTQITNLSDNNNLIGNPYPSAIRGSEFLFTNNTKVEGNLKLWTHGALPAVIASPFYNTFVYNYNSNDYLTYNFTGTSCCPAAGSDIFIGAGQGFVVQMKDGPAGSDVVTFTNSLRSASYDNSVFYRTTNHTTQSLVNLERHRIWLDIIDSNSISDRTLIGYIEGASKEHDSFFDAIGLVGTQMSIFSMIDAEKCTIQGRALPFESDDIVPLAVMIPARGNYKIGIGAVDGLFANPAQNIYLEDRTLGILHNLRSEPYSFEATKGLFDSRFFLRYTDGALAVNNPESVPGMTALIYQKQLLVQASHNIESIKVYDVSGKLIQTYLPKKKDKRFGEDFIFAEGIYLAKIKLSNGMLYTRKLMN